jgi:hypothetical protein
MKKFKQYIQELAVRSAGGGLVPIKKVVSRGVNGKLHKTYPGKSASSGGGSGGGAGGSGDE